MSDLLNQASLVMVPSGYKEDTVYSVVPSDGSGDLSFTRASNGTRVNSAGLVEVCPWNLLQQSETFDNGIWGILNSASVSANTTTAPNGTTTADTLTFSANASSTIYQSISSPAGQTTLSIYAKTASGTKQFRLRIDSPSGNASSDFTATTEWQRFEFNLTTASAGVNFYIINDNAGTAGSIFIWGAQLNIGSTAKPYFPTTDRLNVPRLTYQNGGGGCPSLLLEKQSTNVCLYSEQFDDASWTKARATITANATTSPDGTTNADKFIENTANDSHAVLAAISNTSGQQYAVTIYAKASERNWFLIYVGGGPAQGKFFNLSNGTLGSVLGNAPNDSSIINVGNGWYRCSITYTATDASSDVTFQLATSDGTNSYTGDGTSGLFIWGAQVEQSSYPTSYIPTTSSSATRVADACFKTGISSLIGQTEGTLFVEVPIEDVTSNHTFIRAGITSSFANSIIIEFVGARVYGIVYVSSVAQCSIFSPIQTAGSNLKLALAYKENDFALYINGVQIGTDNSGSVPSSVGSLWVGNIAGTEQNTVKQALLFKTRLTNAQLAELTA